MSTQSIKGIVTEESGIRSIDWKPIIKGWAGRIGRPIAYIPIYLKPISLP